MKLQMRIKIFFSLLGLSHCAANPSLQVFQFGSNDKLGTDGPEPEGGQDYILWENKDLPEGPFPTEFSVCFNMKYETMLEVKRHIQVKSWKKKKYKCQNCDEKYETLEVLNCHEH